MTSFPHQHQQPPSKASLKAWWKAFAFVPKSKKEEPPKEAGGVFGVPLRQSLRYASVHISTANANGQLYIWGYIPVVVAKCGLYLKENATEVEGTFRVNGSNKRMRDLQAIFEAPPRYGKDLDWSKENYTTHDVASVFRRYLTQMPEPVIPHESYYEFRDTYARRPFNQEEVIAAYKRLIQRLPRPNQYLLLYVLDLLSVFARKADKNLMTPTNLAVIFRPGLISHPKHEMSPEQHQLSQQVLEFLIAQQDWFMLDIAPPTGGRERIEGEDEGGPFSDDEEGWNLVDRGKVRLERRRTTSASERTRTADDVASPLSPTADPDSAVARSEPPRSANDLSPVSEKSVTLASSATVSRSRTLPSGSRRWGRGSQRDAPHLLRKKTGPTQ